MTEVGFVTGAGVVAVGMGDDCFVDRLPGIDVKPARGAVEPLIGEFYDLPHCC